MKTRLSEYVKVAEAARYSGFLKGRFERGRRLGKYPCTKTLRMATGYLEGGARTVLGEYRKANHTNSSKISRN